jgi:hypothetical protein
MPTKLPVAGVSTTKPTVNKAPVEFDTTYRDRARHLIEDAMRQVKRCKPGRAVEAYWKEKDLKTDGAILLVNIGTCIAISFVAGAVVAAGVSSAAATFGVAPALGLATAFIIAKSRQEVQYHLASKQVKKGLLHGVDEDEVLGFQDDSLLSPGIAKVLRKYRRVVRRARQLALGGPHTLKGDAKAVARGVLNVLRHPVTEIRAAIQNRKGSLEYRFPGCPVEDNDLNRRLFELRFYGQLLYHHVGDLIGAAVRKRGQMAGDGWYTVYPHILRQVKMAPVGNHRDCRKRGGTCYCMSADEIEQRVEQLKKQGLAHEVKGVGRQTAYDFFKQTAVDAQTVDPRGLLAAIGTKDDPKATHLARRLGQCAVLPVSELGDISLGGTVVDVAQQTGTGVGLDNALATPLAHVSANGVRAIGGALGGVVTAPASYLIGEIMTTIKNRLVRRNVLALGTLFNLEDSSKEAEQKALVELHKWMNSKSLTEMAPRVAAKCVSSLEKLEAVDTKLRPIIRRLEQLRIDRGVERSGFACCEDAYQVAYALHSYFQTSQKLITFLTALEVTLLQLDQTVCDLVGLKRGSLIADGAPIPRKPWRMEALTAQEKKNGVALP